jgi:hypothetical protein
MAYIKDSLEAGEKILFQPSVSKMAYLGAFLNFALSFLPFGVMRLAGTELALTDRRIIGRSGVTKIKMKHADIGYVGVRQSLAGMIFGYGNIIVESKDGARAVFKSITLPVVFQQEANEAIEVAVLGGKLADYGMEKDDLSFRPGQ